MSIITKLQSKFEDVVSKDDYIYVCKGHIRVSLHINRIGRVTDFDDLGYIDYGKCAFYNRNPALRDTIQNLLTEIMDTIEFRQVEYVGDLADFTSREFLFIARSSKTLMFTLEVNIEENVMSSGPTQQPLLHAPNILADEDDPMSHPRFTRPKSFQYMNSPRTYRQYGQSDEIPSNPVLGLKRPFAGIILESKFDSDNVSLFTGLFKETVFESTESPDELVYKPKHAYNITSFLKSAFSNLDYFNEKEIIGVHTKNANVRLTVRYDNRIDLVYIVPKANYVEGGWNRLIEAYDAAEGVSSTGEDLLIATSKFTHYTK